jgi:hypothetical protein
VRHVIGGRWRIRSRRSGPLPVGGVETGEFLYPVALAILTQPPSGAIAPQRSGGRVCAASHDGEGVSRARQATAASVTEVPIDTLKIDRTFTCEVPQEHAGRMLVKTIITLARAFRLTTVAEGVESQEQLSCGRSAAISRRVTSTAALCQPTNSLYCWSTGAGTSFVHPSQRWTWYQETIKSELDDTNSGKAMGWTPPL